MELPKEYAETVPDVFQSLQSRFQKHRINRILVFHFLVDGESWMMRVSPEDLEVKSCTPHTADCTLIISKDIFINTFNRHYTPSMMDLVSGKIKCNKPELLLTLKRVFSDL